jgi:electron transport complex protein RnfG
MRDFFRLAGVLTLISVLSGGALSYTYTITQPIIEANRQQKKIEMLSKVLPSFDNQPGKEVTILKNEKGEPVEFYLGKKDGKPTGVAFRSIAKGYGGDISMMIGVTPDGKVYGIEVISQNETPGLGNKIAHERFTNQFLNKTLSGSRWEVKKRGGDFDQITAATVSSRAVVKGIKEGLSFYHTQAEKIVEKD